MKTKNKGFSPILVFVVVLILGGIGFVAIQSFKQTPSPTPQPEADEASTETKNWKTYRSDEYGFEFKYPAKLSLTEEVPEYSILGEFRITLRSPEAEPKATFPPNSDPEGIKEFVNNHFLDFIAIYKNSKQLTLIDFLEDTYSIKSINPSIAIFDSIKSDLKKNTNFEESLEYEGYFGGENPQKRVFIKNNDYVYQLTLYGCCDTGAPLGDTAKELFNQILSTFEFVENQNGNSIHIKFKSHANLENPLLLIPTELRNSIEEMKPLSTLNQEELNKIGATDFNYWFKIKIKHGVNINDFIEKLNSLDIVETAQEAPKPQPPI